MMAKGVRIVEKTGTSLMLDSTISSQRLCHDTQELVDYAEKVPKFGFSFCVSILVLCSNLLLIYLYKSCQSSNLGFLARLG